MYYILFYKTIHDFVANRIPFREEHLILAELARVKGSLVMAGALADPTDGAVLLFKGDSAEIANNFA